METHAIALGVWVLSALLAAAAGASRDRAPAGFLLGIFLGPIGIPLALFLPAPRRRYRRRR